MKKTISLILSFVILLCCICFSGCNNRAEQVDTKEIKAEDIEKALIEAGFSESHCKKNDDSNWNSVYLDNTETDWISEMNSYGNYIPFFTFNNSRNDIPKILDAVMPLYDKKYKQGDGDEIIHSLINDRGIYNDGGMRGGNIIFNGYEYDEGLDKTGSFTHFIDVTYDK